MDSPLDMQDAYFLMKIKFKKKSKKRVKPETIVTNKHLDTRYIIVKIFKQNLENKNKKLKNYIQNGPVCMQNGYKDNKNQLKQ